MILILGTSGAWAAKSLSPIGQDWPAASPELPKSKSGASFWGEMKKSSKAPESKSLEILDDEDDLGEGKNFYQKRFDVFSLERKLLCF